jgi:hypothetical protein
MPRSSSLEMMVQAARQVDKEVAAPSSSTLVERLMAMVVTIKASMLRE